MIAVSPTCPGRCILGVVGSVKLAGSEDAEEMIVRVFNEHRPRHFVSGGAAGIDAMSEAEADRRTVPKTIHLPERKGWYYYKKRDKLIAKDVECCVRIYSGAATTYGSGWTTNEAEKLGARVWRFKIGEGPARP